MKPKKLSDVKPGGFFTINGTVYKKTDAGPVLKMDTINFGSLADLTPDRSCLPIDKRAAQILLDSK